LKVQPTLVELEKAGSMKSGRMKAGDKESVAIALQVQVWDSVNQSDLVGS
jgi:hypothetical protein